MRVARELGVVARQVGISARQGTRPEKICRSDGCASRRADLSTSNAKTLLVIAGFMFHARQLWMTRFETRVEQNAVQGA